MEPWAAAAYTFLEEWKAKGNVIGALVCGSYVTGNPTPHSDIDLHIILSEDTDWRERGNRVVAGFVIEYFANPPRQFAEYFKEDYESNDRSAVVQILTGWVLFDTQGAIEQLKLEAREWLKKPFAKPSDTAVELSKYTLWDILDNLQDAWEQKTPDFAYIYHNTICLTTRIYCQFLGQPVIGFGKQYRCLSHSDVAARKYLMDPFPDERFVDLFIRATTETDQTRMLPLAEEMTDHVWQAMGGFEIDGWRFRSAAAERTCD